MPEEILHHASLNEVKVSEDEDVRPPKHCQASMQASTLSLSTKSYLRFLYASCVLPPMGLASAKCHVSLYYLTYPEASTSGRQREADSMRSTSGDSHLPQLWSFCLVSWLLVSWHGSLQKSHGTTSAQSRGDTIC